MKKISQEKHQKKKKNRVQKSPESSKVQLLNNRPKYKSKNSDTFTKESPN